MGLNGCCWIIKYLVVLVNFLFLVRQRVLFDALHPDKSSEPSSFSAGGKIRWEMIYFVLSILTPCNDVIASKKRRVTGAEKEEGERACVC